MDDLTRKPANELAALVRAGELSAPELVEATLRRIEAVEPSICAFGEVDAEGAIAAARAVEPGDERPFAGVPIAVKGNTAVTGRPFDLGSRALAGHRVAHDAFLVRRLRAAGFVIVGTTRLPEFGILPTTEPRHGGPVRNPWNHERTPGGSSGGSAAAVAAGMLPIAHGNDGGGSLRIPAACCGVVGLKPSRGRVSRGPELGESMLGVDGVLSRTVADTAAAIDVLGGYEVGDATWAPRPDEPYRTAAQRNPDRLRIALTDANTFGFPIDPESRRALRDTGELLAGLGHHVEEAAPELPGPDALDLFTTVFSTHISLGVAFAAAMRGGELGPDDVEPLSRGMYEHATAATALDYMVAVTRLQQITRQVVRFWADYDLLLTPVLAERPLPVGELNGDEGDPRTALLRAARFTPYPALFNVTGQPAISLPAGVGADGLPNAVQIVAAPLGEDVLLAVAAQIETARPWAEDVPAVAAAGAAV